MTRTVSILILSLAAALAGAAPAFTQTADSSLTVQRSLSVATVRATQVASPGQGATLSLRALVDPDAPAEVQVTGDPGRVYRIRIPTSLMAADGQTIIDDLKIWSANSGDVSTTRVAHMDLQGRDLLRITGRLRLADGAILDAVSLPLSIDYE